MANPFLVLGGIAVGIITASFGVLQVPGWVASAQDASAINDLRMISEAQAASASLKGTYAGDISTLQSGGLGLSFSIPDERVKHFAADADGWCSVAISDSGRYFGVSNTASEAVSAATMDAAIAAACGVTEGEAEQPPVDLGPATTQASTFSVGTRVRDIAFSPDGRTAYITHGGKSFSVVDVATNKVTPIATDIYPGVVAVSPDGAFVAVGWTDVVSSNVVVYNTDDLTIAKTLPFGQLNDIAWTADGSKLIVSQVSGLGNAIMFVDRGTWASAGSVKLGSRYYIKLTPLPDNKVLVASAMDVAYTVDSQTLQSALVTRSAVKATAAGDDTVWLGLSGSDDGVLLQVNGGTMTPVQRVLLPYRGVRHIETSSEGRWLYVQSSTALNIYDTRDNSLVSSTAMADGDILRMSPDGAHLYLSRMTADGKITVLTPDAG